MLYLLKFYFTLMCNVYLLNLIMAHANLQTNVILQFHAMDTLHKASYDTSKGSNSLVPSGGPVLCRDEMEEWSASEANLFEEALQKYGKDFNDIRQDFVSRTD